MPTWIYISFNREVAVHHPSIEKMFKQLVFVANINNVFFPLNARKFHSVLL